MEKVKKNLLDLSREELEIFFGSIGEKAFRGRQLFTWLHRKRVTDLNSMTDLSKNLRQRLAEAAEIQLPTVDNTAISEDGLTKKFLLKLSDGLMVETVLMKESKRVTLCLSTQVGCGLGCRFCATAKMGFKRNLTVGEIIGQYFVGAKESVERISNLVLMGMGEPLLNYQNVAKALMIFTDGEEAALSSRRITVSTAGIIPGLERMTQDKLPCKLAVSLNAPDDKLRAELMPVAKKYPLDELMLSLHRYEKSTRHRVTFEYVLIGGVNDSEEHARKLKRRLGGFTAKLNLIAFNPIDSAFTANKHRSPSRKWNFSRPREAAIQRFAEIFCPRHGLTVIIRKSKGEDISAACGQLCAL